MVRPCFCSGWVAQVKQNPASAWLGFVSLFVCFENWSLDRSIDLFSKSSPVWLPAWLNLLDSQKKVVINENPNEQVTLDAISIMFFIHAQLLFAFAVCAFRGEFKEEVTADCSWSYITGSGNRFQYFDFLSVQSPVIHEVRCLHRSQLYGLVGRGTCETWSEACQHPGCSQDFIWVTGKRLELTPRFHSELLCYSRQDRNT